ncbi:trans-aconitate 2-methyltransferase [Aestuariivirga sp.]|uniref:trans-aconitate 2-methyltransferase n=1 Tax=Aestuariivirga sp. TaxID=2650926 RepID=UPI00359486CD
MSDWRPGLYLKFADERTRPARDLLAQVPLQDPQSIYDLGCGPGNSTALLVERFPQASVTGIDNSPAMLDAARIACPSARFLDDDLTDWMPDWPPALLFSNAALQWVPGHLGVLERLAGTLGEGGVLAVQMPDNLMEPSHRLMQEVAEQGPWSETLRLASAARDPLPAPIVYYRRLKPLFSRLDIWHTTYNHPLQGAAGIVEWVKSTGLRPYLDPLTECERVAFLADYESRLAEAYPEDDRGTVLLRFPRLFLVGQR